VPFNAFELYHGYNIHVMKYATIRLVIIAHHILCFTTQNIE